MTSRNFKVFMKQSHDSSDDYEFPVTANETQRKDCCLHVVTIDARDWVRIPANTDILFLFVVLCNDNNIIMFYAYGCLHVNV